jgi:hypothetical protein
MRFGGGEFSTGTMRNFQPELTPAHLSTTFREFVRELPRQSSVQPPSRPPSYATTTPLAYPLFHPPIIRLAKGARICRMEV